MLNGEKGPLSSPRHDDSGWLRVLKSSRMEVFLCNGTNRAAITLQSVTAVSSFHRMGHGNLKVSLYLAIPVVFGSLLGAWVATWVPDAENRSASG